MFDDELQIQSRNESSHIGKFSQDLGSPLVRDFQTQKDSAERSGESPLLFNIVASKDQGTATINQPDESASNSQFNPMQILE